jgi:hypothetical protein
VHRSRPRPAFHAIVSAIQQSGGTMLYQQDAQGDWGQMRATDTCTVSTEMMAMSDGIQLFMRS